MPHTRSPLLVALVVAVSLLLAGCTLIGFAIGNAIDAEKRKNPRVVPNVDVVRLRPGERIKLFLHDGAAEEGRYEGLAPVAPEYSARYAQAREEQGPSALPALGSTVEVTREDGKLEPRTFHGFEPGAVLLLRQGEADPRALPFKAVRRLSWPDGGSDGDTLAARMTAGKIPCRSRLIVEGRKVAIETVDRVETQAWDRRAARKGALIGAIFDVALVVTAAVVANDLSDASYFGPTYSCPFVYAWDGGAYRREAEMYGGAVVAALARTDRAPLPRLRPHDGRLRLRVSNEQNEVDYLDRVALLEVRTAPGARVITSPEGEPFVFGKLSSPRLATDRRGRDVRAAVAAEDGTEWTSDPLGVDPERDGPRDALLLEFDRPAGAARARLVFSLRSTAWGASLLGDLLDLKGPDLPAYYARLESDEGERQRLVAAWAREGLPQVEVWDGTGFRHAGFLRNLGPLSRTQALAVAVPAGAGETLRVRFGATAGLWRVDWAAADLTEGPAFEVRELPLLSARARSGEIVTERVRARDGRTHEMPPGASAIDLEFAASEATRAGKGEPARSYVVEASGHYRILRDTPALAQAEVFERMLATPGAFGRQALGRLRRDLLLAASAQAAP